jgi:L-cystine uptake protein TcyP (sodium:dicarboxylate symporter family)
MTSSACSLSFLSHNPNLFLVFLQEKTSFTVRVMLALALGLAFGVAIQLVFGRTSDVATLAKNWLSIMEPASQNCFSF